MAFSDKESRPKGQQQGGPHTSGSQLVGGGLSSSALAGSTEDKDRAFAFLTLSSFSQLSLLSRASSYLLPTSCPLALSWKQVEG